MDCGGRRSATPLSSTRKRQRRSALLAQSKRFTFGKQKSATLTDGTLKTKMGI